MNDSTPAYGLWSLVLLNSAIFIMFAFSFFKPQTARDWRTFGAFAAFIVALFVEMYGFPLTIYLMSGWLQTKYPSLDLMSHNTGHLWSTLLGEKGDPILNLVELFSKALFKIINWVMKLAPMAAFGAMAFTVSKFGLGSLVSLGAFGWLVLRR